MSEGARDSPEIFHRPSRQLTEGSSVHPARPCPTGSEKKHKGKQETGTFSRGNVVLYSAVCMLNPNSFAMMFCAACTLHTHAAPEALGSVHMWVGLNMSASSARGARNPRIRRGLTPRPGPLFAAARQCQTRMVVPNMHKPFQKILVSNVGKPVWGSGAKLGLLTLHKFTWWHP